MYAISLAVEINPPGIELRLTREEMWRGLVMKARDAVPFVPGMTRCEVVEDLAQGFWREVEFQGQTFRERVTLTAPVQLLFEREPGTENAGWITNTITELDGQLILSFTFAVRFPGTSDGSPEEAASGEQMRHTYEAAVASTLNRVREMAARVPMQPSPVGGQSRIGPEPS